MFFAVNEAGVQVQAAPGVRATCPMCKSEVIAKCGDIIMWHFAHKHFRDCDTWGEPKGETAWHLAWKSLVPPHMREYVIRRTLLTEDGPREWVHRADVLNSRQTVVELQHSPLKPAEALEREAFYENMIWVIDVVGFRPRFRFFPSADEEGAHDFTWTPPKRWLFGLRKPVFLDFGSKDMFHVKRFTPNIRRVTGVGRFIDKKTFKELFFV